MIWRSPRGKRSWLRLASPFFSTLHHLAALCHDGEWHLYLVSVPQRKQTIICNYKVINLLWVGTNINDILDAVPPLFYCRPLGFISGCVILFVLCRLIWLPLCKFFDVMQMWHSCVLSEAMPKTGHWKTSTAGSLVLIFAYQPCTKHHQIWVTAAWHPYILAVWLAKCTDHDFFAFLPPVGDAHTSAASSTGCVTQVGVSRRKLWEGPQADALIIKLERSLTAWGTQEAVDLSPPLSCDQISYIWYQAAMQFHVATRHCNWSVKRNCFGVSLRISVFEKLNPQA